MAILLTGIDGYMGWPAALRLSKEFPDEKIIGVDNLARRNWVNEGNSTSMVPIKNMEKRVEKAKEKEYENIIFEKGDLVDQDFVYDLVKKYEPKTILHLAAQPSAPYSQKDGKHAHYTQKNDVLSTVNLMWALRDNNMDDTHFIETTTTGVYGAPNLQIPEGFIKAVDRKGRKDEIPYPCMAGSWYHVTKGFDAINMRLFNNQTGITSTDLRTSIVYGLETEETKEDEAFKTRFDIDFYFGTLFNRWTSMAVVGYPLTVYGTGNQIKPFIHLEDCTESLVNAVKINNDGKLRVLNQTTEDITIKTLAEQIKESASEVLGNDVEIKHIENPRKESEDKEYHFDREKFMKLLGKQKYTMESSMPEVLENLSKHKGTIDKYKETFLK